MGRPARTAGSRRSDHLIAAVLAIGLLAILIAIIAARSVVTRTDDDLSAPCGPTASFLAPHCFGGVTAGDMERPLLALGYDCTVAHGVERTAVNCLTPRPATTRRGDEPFVQLEPRGDRVLSAAAMACGAPRDGAIEALFEAVAVGPFPRDSAHAGRARAWVAASLDGRSHDRTIGGYRYAVSWSAGCAHLSIDA